MKINFKSRKTLLSLAAIAGTAALALIIAVVIIFRSHSAPEGTPDISWAGHIKAYTSGEISKLGTVRVIFNSDIIDEDQVGIDATGVFHFSSTVKGKGTWVKQDEVEFVPDKPLEPGKHYTVTLKLDDYISVPQESGDFFFSFDVIKQDFDLTFEGFSFPDLEDLNVQEYRGRVNLADAASDEEVEKLISAKQKGSDLSLRWEHEAGKNSHRFIIEKISRGKEESSFNLYWDGAPLHIDKKGDREITVHARGIFELVSSKAVFSDLNYIALTFTDPLKQDQNLKGLVYIEGKASTTEIDGNIIKVFPSEKILGKVKVHIAKGIKNSEKKALKQSYYKELTLKQIDPGIRFVGKGNILPDTDHLTVPFEAVNVRSVQVTAFKVYSKNMGQFFQVNSLKEQNQMRRVGRYLWRKTINLNASSDEMSQWNRYSLDVSKLYKENPNSLFQIEISINRSNAAIPCAGEGDPSVKEADFSNLDDESNNSSSNWDYWEEEYNYSNDWQNRKNPCVDAYYNPKYGNPVKSSRNFVASDIGITAKYGAGKSLNVVTTRITSAKPVATTVTVYNYQNIAIGEGKTDSNGLGEVILKGDGKPFYLVASKDKDKGYLRLSGEQALPTSHFDVGGDLVKDGVKGYIYGERGVWRPGDPIYLTLVIEDKEKTIPENHPVTMELYNPKGQLKIQTQNFNRVNNFYSFKLQTDPDDITGTWTARAKLGGLTFSKTVNIEMVVPNRLKVELDLDKKELHASDLPVTAKIHSQWLHGALASNLKSDVSVVFTKKPVNFTSFSDYTFEDIVRPYSSEKSEVFSGNLDPKGDTSFSLNFNNAGTPPGMLTAHFITRVHEKGGGFSIESSSLPYHPYKYYVGIKTPKGDQARGMLLTDKDHTVGIATINSQGKKVSRSGIKVSLYKIKWKWWWETSGNDAADFASASQTHLIQQDTVNTKNGYGEWKFQIKYPEWGRYLVRAEDSNGGHIASKIIYLDWPGWAGRAREEKGVGATRLNFTADKEKYSVGDKATIYLPESQTGYALVSIENSRKVLSQQWVKPEKSKNKLTIPITEDMSPNVYVNVSLIQPHQNKDNDGPLRLYGIIPLIVENPKSVLSPKLDAPDEIRPGKETQITVSETTGKKMTYTIAIVDEGLLGLTRFGTPDLHSWFYRREALGVRSWDLFDDVVGAYGGELSRILSLGGGADGADGGSLRESRFPPVVKFMGPFELKGGEHKKHTFTLPPYIGSVRIMVVAGNGDAYGKTDKSVFVRQPLMVQGTLPRVIGPNEEMNIPVTVFTKSNAIKNVTVNVASDDLKFPEGSKAVLHFSKQGNKSAFIRARTGATVGKAKITITASGNGEKDSQEIYLPIRSANPLTVKSTTAVIEPGKSWNGTLEAVGVANTNSATIELSSMAPIHLDQRIDYLIQYPHGCLEQTTSSAFPQLYLANLMKLEDDKKQEIENNIKVAIDKIAKFQGGNGNFYFWPGSENTYYDWANIYAGHFLVEADRKGYNVAQEMLSSWKNRQRRTANSWSSKDKEAGFIQAYRLYVLALAGSPSMNSMNRLRESGKLNSTSSALLAAAYYRSGKKDEAEEIIEKASGGLLSGYSLPGITFGSDIRDDSLKLIALTQLKRESDGKKLADKISGLLSSDKYLSTQSTSFALMAMAGYTKGSHTSYDLSYTLKIDGKSQKGSSSKALAQKEISDLPMTGIPVEVTNTNKEAKLYLVINSKGSPKPGEEEAEEKNLAVKVRYLDSMENEIDPESVKQGEDIKVEITVTNEYGKPLEHMALTQIVPSGWQIQNSRFETGFSGEVNDLYQDFRDDRVINYFSLKSGEHKIFVTGINASFAGKYYLPAIRAEDMYTLDAVTTVKGRWTEVVKE
jgi:uncharacterized protein YfaS (alpha-2-macroglobulin family)